jgi:hypothetical protein
MASNNGSSSTSSAMDQSFSDNLSVDVEHAALSALLTLIVVTSPVAAHPSTELLDSCLGSYYQSLGAMDDAVRVIVAADGCVIEPRKHGRIFGRAELHEAERYMQYLATVRARCDARPQQFSLVRSAGWRGFAMTLKAALLRVTTPFVLVTCHDLNLTRDVPTRRILRLLANEADSHVRYVGIPGPNNYGRRYIDRGSTPQFRIGVVDRDGVPLVQLLRWKENTHFARTDTYLRFVFANESFHRFRRGQFIEETFGQLMVKRIRAAPSPVAEHDAFGVYLLYLGETLAPGEHAPIVHINGRNYRSVSERLASGLKVQKYTRSMVDRANWFARRFFDSSTFSDDLVNAIIAAGTDDDDDDDDADDDDDGGDDDH